MSRAYHLNLLRESERVSSSPIRLRVMLPIAALLACAGMFVWWGTIGGQALLAQTNVSRLKESITARRNEHKSILEQIAGVRETSSRLEQLEGYRLSCRRWGEMLRHLAETTPLKVQLTHLKIPPPPALLPAAAGRQQQPKGSPPKAMPPPAAANAEKVSLVLAGRAPRETPIIALMESLETEAFTNNLTILKDPRSPDQSPRVKSFRQEAAAHGEGQRFLAFEIEYIARERRFAK